MWGLWMFITLNKREDIEIDKVSSWIMNQDFQSPGQADKEI